MARLSGEENTRNMVSPTGYCYADGSSTNPHIQTHHLVNQLQGFESDQEMYNLTTGIELIGLPPKNNNLQHYTNPIMWKGIFGKVENTSSKAIKESDFYQQEFTKSDFVPDNWHDNIDDPSLRCVFPCEANERPSQGLSLSLSSNNPSTIGLQSFELRQQDDMRFVGSSSRDVFFGKPMGVQQQQQMNNQDGFFSKAANTHPHHGHLQIRNSKYLGPTQELLNEFCNLGTKETDHHSSKPKTQKINQWKDENESSSSKQPSLHSLDLLELQKRKSKLLQMLEEVDRRYKNYCDQMKAVVCSFEAVAGNGAATVYSALASKAMSRHFRCLRDGIVNQIKAAKKAMGEKDSTGPGGTRGETPRLRLLDQTLRQQRAFQQMSMMEAHPWRPQRGLPERSVSVLRAWLFEHFLHPYPSDVDKHILARQTGLSRSQVANWFINARVRLWKPMVEEMYLEETKEQDNVAGFSDGVTAPLDDDNNGGQMNHTSQTRNEDKKPTPDQLVRIDSECLSSIINIPEKNDPKNTKTILNDQQPNDFQQPHSFGRINTDSFGAVDLHFSSYNPHSAGTSSYINENSHQNYSGGGVSLTLGLQQHGGGGMSLSFSPTSQNSLFYPRDHIEDCQPVQYSLLDGEGQNLPYRNLMGAQLLHDLAG